MPYLVTFLMRHAAIGCALAVLFVGGLVGLDVGGLGKLVATSPDGLLAVALLTFGLAITFSSVQMGFAVMLLGDADDRGGGRKLPVKALELVPVRVTPRRRSR